MTLPNTSCSPDEGHCVWFGRCLEASFDTEMDSFVYLFSCSTGPRWTAAKMHKLKSEYESERQANISDSNTSVSCSSHTKSLFEETQHAIRRRPALDVVPTRLEVICFGERPNPYNMCWNLPGIPAPLNLCERQHAPCVTWLLICRLIEGNLPSCTFSIPDSKTSTPERLNETHCGPSQTSGPFDQTQNDRFTCPPDFSEFTNAVRLQI